MSEIDGIIIADLPIEESRAYRATAMKENLSTVFLAAPTTEDSRLRILDEASTGFLYCVSVTGVTGERTDKNEALSFLMRARKQVKKNSIYAGFGITNGDDASALARHADGVIVGSALLRTIVNQGHSSALKRAGALVSEIRERLDHLS
jgi:tryptophan synthase alpha chain